MFFHVHLQQLCVKWKLEIPAQTNAADIVTEQTQHVVRLASPCFENVLTERDRQTGGKPKANC